MGAVWSLLLLDSLCPSLSSSHPCSVNYDLSDCALWMTWVWFLTQFISQDRRKSQLGIFFFFIIFFCCPAQFCKNKCSLHYGDSDRNKLAHRTWILTSPQMQLKAQVLFCICAIFYQSPSGSIDCECLMLHPLLTWWLWAGVSCTPLAPLPSAAASWPETEVGLQVDLLASSGWAP